MKSLIAYFSQTGNTELVARAIAAGLADGDEGSVDVKPIGKLASDDWLRYDFVGLGMPVFYYHEPANVRDWILALTPRDRPVPMFTFNTNGGNPCNTFRRVQKMLRPKGGRVLESFECYGYDTYPIYLKSFRQWGHPDEKDLAAARDFGRNLVPEAALALSGEEIREATYRFVGGKTFRLSWLCRKPILDRFFPRLNLHGDLCIRCGACARACPTENITLDPYPVFDNRCIHCYLCERICPRNAIRCDWRRLIRRMNP